MCCTVQHNRRGSATPAVLRGRWRLSREGGGGMADVALDVGMLHLMLHLQWEVSRGMNRTRVRLLPDQ